MCPEDPIVQTAKAVEAVAIASGKAIDATTRFGGFIAEYVRGPIEQGMGIFEDKLKYMRWERQIRLMQRAHDLLREVGLERPTRSIPLKLAIPLLEAASLEDDDRLQDIWARLLVNAADDQSGQTLQYAYIEILRQLTPLEAILLQKMYSLPYDEMRHHGVQTVAFPSDAMVFDERIETSDPSDEVKLALSNLARLGCLRFSMSWGGGELYTRVNPTLLGKSFVDACTLRKTDVRE